MPFVDLHLHSHFSDGSDPPGEIVDRAVAAGASAIAITDHDTVAGVVPGQEAAASAGLEFLTGVEISAGYRFREIHVLGLGIDTAGPALTGALEALCASRASRGFQILERLRAINIMLPQLDKLPVAAGGALGRMHIACAMTDAGYVKKPQDAFDRYLNAGKPAYVPKQTLPLEEALDLIHGAGGLAFVAHPGLGKWVAKILPALLELPFDGIEAYHVSHSPGRVEEFTALARERGLLITGGSDCHGLVKGRALLGTVHTPEWVYLAIRNRLGR